VPSHFSQVPLSLGARKTLSILPCSVPFDSVMRISALGLPLTSSMFRHKPTGEALSAHAAGDMSAAAATSATTAECFKLRIPVVSSGMGFETPVAARPASHSALANRPDRNGLRRQKLKQAAC
jgi:hypothetical protein